VADQGIIVFGIPIPSSSPLFLSIVAVHVAAGLVSSVAGVVAMLARKRAGRHPSAGAVYYWSLVVVFLTMTALSILRWPHNTHLFVLGILSFGAGASAKFSPPSSAPSATFGRRSVLSFVPWQRNAAYLRGDPPHIPRIPCRRVSTECQRDAGA
jgi:hypothetical protein